jgi:type I restriction enzyme S subunit
MTNLVQLGDVCDFLDHLRKPVAEELRRPGPYPYYGANGQQGTIDAYLFDEPLVLLAEDGGHFGSKTKPIAYKVQGKTWVNNHAHVLRPRPNCDINFLTHVLSYLDVRKHINGSTRPKLTKANAEQILVPFPNLAEQRRLATVLDGVARFRTMRRYTLQLCDELTTSTFRHFCRANAAHLSSYTFGDTEVLEIIDGDRGAAYPKKTDFTRSGDCLFLNTGNVLNGEFDFQDCDFISARKDAELRKGKLLKGDVVLTTRGTLGNNALYDDSITHKQVRINSGMVLLRANKAKLLPDYLVAILNSRDFTQQVTVATSGSAQQQLPIFVLANLKLELPPVSLQEEFITLANGRKHLRSIYREAARQADHLFQTLLHGVFKH